LLAASLGGIARLLSTGEPAAAAVRLLAATDTDTDGWDWEYTGRLNGWFREDDTAARAATRAALGEAPFAQAWAEGEALSLEQATDLALAALADLAVAEAVDPTASASDGETG
jgi:hypothetical protein